MDIVHEVIHKAQTETPPVNQELKGITGFSLEKFEAACRQRGVTLEDTIAGFIALRDEDAEDAKFNRISLKKEQASMALRMADKYEPDKASIKHTGDAKEPVTFIIEK